VHSLPASAGQAACAALYPLLGHFGKDFDKTPASRQNFFDFFKKTGCICEKMG
jgi:hypothetical protein